MNSKLQLFIDTFIREHADKDPDFGYNLSVGCDLDVITADRLVKKLIELDQHRIYEMILERAQDLIDERIDEVEEEDRKEHGLETYIDSKHGDILISRVRI